MGCFYSTSNDINKVRPASSSNNEDEHSLSNTLSKKYREMITTPRSSNRWKIKLSKSEARMAYISDGTLPADAADDLLALRVFLEDPTSLMSFADFARKRNKLDYLLCWIEILGFRLITVGNAYQRSTANIIYHKYFKEDAVVPLPLVSSLITQSHRDTVRGLLELAEKKDTFALSMSLFDPFAHELLRQMNYALYQPFQSSILYMWTLIARRQQYNHVGVDDFEYMELLGQGGFGMVVHCKKKSTGKHYAMKIQSKVGLLEVVRDRPKRVTCERDVLVKCHHPFIISMDYAFQTPDFAILVTALGSGTSLKSCLKISEERVRFYAAEIVLALNHIHEMGMIYRDLKPANVLLNADGHIQLVDMGGVVDVDGETVGGGLASMAMHGDDSALFAASLDQAFNNSIGSRKFVSDILSEKSNSDGSDSFVRGKASSSRLSSTKKRARTIMGTAGYMAPEMLYQRALARETRTGYTYAVDYWALGVTVFVLLTGSLPFPPDKVAGFMAVIAEKIETDGGFLEPPAYALWYNWVCDSDATTLISDNCKKFLTGLLTIDENERLGSGARGIKKVKGHRWFKDLSWSLLEQKLVTPPSVLTSVHENEENQLRDAYSSFESMMNDIGDDFAIYKYVAQPSPQEQQFFRPWDFIAPGVLKMEVGFQEEERGRLSMLEKHARPLVEISTTNNYSVSLNLTAHDRAIGSRVASGSISMDQSIQYSGAYGVTQDAATIEVISDALKVLKQ